MFVDSFVNYFNLPYCQVFAMF